MTRALLSILLLAFASRADGGSNPFIRVSGTVTYIREAPEHATRVIAVENETNACVFFCSTDKPNIRQLKTGFTVDCTGHEQRNDTEALLINVDSCRLIGSSTPPPPVATDISALLDGKYDFRLTSFEGTLRDITSSETASRWIILVVCDPHDRIFVSVPAADGSKDRLSKLLGERIAVTGICTPSDSSRRLKCGHTFKVASEGSITPVTAPPVQTTDVPDVGTIQPTRLSQVLSLGRHTAVGRVIAVCRGTRVLLERDGGDIVDLELAETPPPRFGERIRAIGLPESDLFRINLSHATWTRLQETAADSRAPLPVTPEDITRTQQGDDLVDSSFHGRFISLKGVVRSVSSGAPHLMHVECDKRLVAVDSSACPDAFNGISIDCRIRVSGTCVIEHEERHQSSAFPRLKGFILAVRTPDDIEILARPSWWTPGRLLAVIGSLLALLLGILIWNVTLRRLATRKGRELMHEQLGHVKAELKTEERTRLAVELHDSLAQNLTGVSLEIDTATKVADNDPASMKAHLGIAARSLKSCRDELRNCLWDLRNRALEEQTMDAAIRQTLSPHIAGVDVAIRFNVPRERISDNTAHAILRIIRELTLNAIRHGGATRLWIAGSIEGARMLFSVRDNGCGFDPENTPSFSEGHYGLLGIRERVDEFEGEFALRSSPGQGTKATLSLKVPQET